MESCWRGLLPIKRDWIALRSLWKVCGSSYSQQNGRYFIANPEEMKAFLGKNYVMAANQLPSISMYWDCDHFIGSNSIQNIFTRCRYQEILQIIVNKIKPAKATKYPLSLITWTNHSKKATRTSLSKALMRIWPSSGDVLQWDNIWKWKQLNVVLNGGLDFQA